jgi:hypothetical protein
MLASQAARAERLQPLPGDELPAESARASNHVIAVRAVREAIWPWLVQMGCDRAGRYPYDRLDNTSSPSATVDSTGTAGDTSP